MAARSARVSGALAVDAIVLPYPFRYLTPMGYAYLRYKAPSISLLAMGGVVLVTVALAIQAASGTQPSKGSDGCKV
jgi:hypothetical protein